MFTFEGRGGSDPIRSNDEISPPILYGVYFITFMDSSKANLVLKKNDKTWDWQTPPPLGWEKIPKNSKNQF